MENIDQNKTIDYLEIVKVIFNNKKNIIKITALFTLITVGITLIMPSKFESKAIVLPEVNSGGMGAFGGLADIASVAGLSLGEQSWVDLYPNLLKSETILKSVIYAKYKSKEFKDSVNLIQYWDIDDESETKKFELALEKIRKELQVEADKKTKIVTIAIVVKEPQLAADIIFQTLGTVDEFIRTKRTSSASERRKWVEQRLQEVKSDLQRSENNLKEFRERNRRISDSPELLLQQERFLRDVAINSNIYTELKKQFEIARIEEINNIPIINILDYPRAAATKSFPKRSITVIVVFLLVFISTCSYYIIDFIYGNEIRPFLRNMMNIIRS